MARLHTRALSIGHHQARWVVALLLLGGCAGDSPAIDAATPRDAAPSDAPRRDAGSPLPSAADVLDPIRYDCRATAPVEPPTRPHAPGCLLDPECTGRFIAAHRMGPPFAPESSLSALRASILLGVDVVETDIRLTSDGQVVLMHDGSVDRTLMGSGDVADLTLAEIQALPMRTDADLPPGDFACDRAPDLDGVFAISRGRIIVELEVKNQMAGVVAAIYLRDAGLFEDAFLLCDPDECAAARAMVPDVPIMTRPRAATEVLGQLAYDPTPRLVHVDVNEAFLTPELMGAMHGIGAEIYGNAFAGGDALALVANDPSGYLDAFDRGIDVLQCEFPHWALMTLGRLDTAGM